MKAKKDRNLAQQLIDDLLQDEHEEHAQAEQEKSNPESDSSSDATENSIQDTNFSRTHTRKVPLDSKTESREEGSLVLNFETNSERSKSSSSSNEQSSNSKEDPFLT